MKAKHNKWFMFRETDRDLLFIAKNGIKFMAAFRRCRNLFSFIFMLFGGSF